MKQVVSEFIELIAGLILIPLVLLFRLVVLVLILAFLASPLILIVWLIGR